MEITAVFIAYQVYIDSSFQIKLDVIANSYIYDIIPETC